ncbi:MAG TPA: hypothetical protein ENH87_01925 [Pricia antarctica]|uniref:Uncharacterized protein n=1 Tax=Pricia antarctica TaxID=641691 RepID=A0A831QJ89_9FLAO|nr:hypothetical protein [Pricia antarctica]
MYWKKFKYILQHKWFVFLECLKTGQIIHGIFHDCSKFLPSEFIPYAKKFFGNISEDDQTFEAIQKFGCHEAAPFGFYIEEQFSIAWLLHQHRNKHHCDYWVDSDNKIIPMPIKYVNQMIVDWRAMGRKFGDTAEDFYSNNAHKMKLHPITIERIKHIFDIDNLTLAVK